MYLDRDGLWKAGEAKKKKQSAFEKWDGESIFGFILILIEEGVDKVIKWVGNHSTFNNGGGDKKPPRENKFWSNFNMNFSKKIAMLGGGFILGLVLLVGMVGINYAGHRTVVQHLNGTLEVVFEPGPYIQAFGSTTEYNDVITMDFNRIQNDEKSTVDQTGISVRYQDGGQGHLYGIARYRLPMDEPQMLHAHKEFRSNNGIAHKRLKPTTEEISNHTAGLMTSEESYAERRGELTQMIKHQLEKGKYETVQKPIVTTEAGFEFCLEQDLTDALKKECKDVKKTTKNIPVIAIDDKTGQELMLDSDFNEYGITLAGFTIVDWGYEDKTLAQIAEKRRAGMAIITSKAKAEEAKQDAITAEQKGLADVQVAKYEEEVIKQKAIVVAQREAEVAVIAATQLVQVAHQSMLEQKNLKLAAYETKQKEIALGQGEAERKRLNMQADGALHPKLEAWKAVNFRYADNIGKQKWVSEITMGGSDGSQSSNASALIDMFAAKTAKELSLDMSIKTTK